MFAIMLLFGTMPIGAITKRSYSDQSVTGYITEVIIKTFELFI